jgi:hypothetical protein
MVFYVDIVCFWGLSFSIVVLSSLLCRFFVLSKHQAHNLLEEIFDSYSLSIHIYRYLCHYLTLF